MQVNSSLFRIIFSSTEESVERLCEVSGIHPDLHGAEYGVDTAHDCDHHQDGVRPDDDRGPSKEQLVLEEPGHHLIRQDERDDRHPAEDHPLLEVLHITSSKYLVLLCHWD